MNNIFSLSGKVAVITGGEGVLGSTIARAFSDMGVRTAILGINKPAADEVVKELVDSGGEAIAVETNVLNKEDVEKAKDIVIEKWGTIDILLNAAGGNMPGATISPEQTIFDLQLDDLDKVTSLNFKGSVIPSLVFGKVFANNKSGCIVNFSSMTAQSVVTRVVGYSAAKASIDNFTKWMAVEMAQKFGEGVRVNAIAPGFFITKQNKDLLTNPDGTYTERGNDVIQNTPFNRFGTPDELIGTIVYLCSEASKFVTGTVIPIDGGFSIYSGV